MGLSIESAGLAEQTALRFDAMVSSALFLRTTIAPNGKEYATLDEARLALGNLINRQSESTISVTEQGDGTG